LSFVCYNAFLKDAVVIIDEPEISLHPDWQRRLIPTLKSQNSANQFILTTHSPFIYSKFPEREICLSDDKGE
jgi:predicted ATP-dependent endonuclease of OLD family